LKDINTEKNLLKSLFDRIKTRQPLAVGDVIYGPIQQVSENVAFVNIEHAEKNKAISPSGSAVLLIKDIDRTRVEKIDDYFRKGDIIRAKVIDINKFGAKVSTVELGMGAIQAYCSNCKQALSKNSGASQQIRCLNCGTIQTRKITRVKIDGN